MINNNSIKDTPYFKKKNQKKKNESEKSNNKSKKSGNFLPLNEDDNINKNQKEIKQNIHYKKSKILKLKKINNKQKELKYKRLRKKDFEIDRPKGFISSEKSSGTSEDQDSYSEEENKSLIQLQLERANRRNANYEIIKIKTNEKISLEKITKYFKDNNYDELKKYKFPYISQNNFNYEIFKIDLKHLRSLYFACPECTMHFRHFSMAYHIFQNHFENMYKYLSNKMIAHCCSKMMEKEFRKIENDLNNFADLAILFNSCEFEGNSEWRRKATNSIKTLKNLDIKKKFFGITKEDAIQNLTQKFPLNKNKKYKKE